MIRIDPEFKTLIPQLTPDERSGLEESILKDGCRDALVVWGDILIDGHNRYEICNKHGIGYDTVSMEFESRSDVKIWIIKNQLARRNLQPYVRTTLILELEDVIAEQAKERQKEYHGNQYEKPQSGLVQTFEQVQPEPMKNKTAYKIGELAGVSHETVRKVKTLEEKAPEEVKEKLRSGEMTINKAFNDIKRKEERAEREQAVVEIPLPTGKYSVILADPPWRYEFSETGSREIENHYPTMDLEEIKALDIPFDDNAVLLLWTTAPKLAESIEVLKAWGFNYRTCAVWDKERKGMGYWFRVQHELILVGVKGEFRTPYPENRYDSVIRAPRGEHSKKPDVVYDMIEKMFPGERYLELFARNIREGWSSWGNQL